MPATVSMLQPADSRGRHATAGIAIRHANLYAGGLAIAHVRNLRFPFALRIEVEAGICELTVRGFTRTLRRGECRTLPALERLSITLCRRGALALVSLPADEGPPNRSAVIDDIRHRKPVTAALALAVFASPESDWRISSASASLGHLLTGRLSQRLLQENESFRDVVRSQRLARFMLDLASAVEPPVPTTYGFGDRCHLENALYDQFGDSAELIARLAIRV